MQHGRSILKKKSHPNAIQQKLLLHFSTALKEVNLDAPLGISIS